MVKVQNHLHVSRARTNVTLLLDLHRPSLCRPVKAGEGLLPKATFQFATSEKILAHDRQRPKVALPIPQD